MRHRTLIKGLFLANTLIFALTACGDSGTLNDRGGQTSDPQDTGLVDADTLHDTSPTADTTMTDVNTHKSDAQIATDTNTSPDDTAIPEPDVATLKPDASTPPEPEPSWDCAKVQCDTVDVTATVGRMKALDECAFELALEKSLASGVQRADKLLNHLKDNNIGKHVTIKTVLANLNRDGQPELTSASKTRLSGQSPDGFRWNTNDINTQMWYPQGITGSSDARANSRVEGRRLLLTSWYHKTDDRPTRGARVTLVDITNTNNIKYRHLLLVDPIDTPNGPSFTEAAYDGGNALHAGGIVWYGDYLYVADTSKGIRIYDMSRIFQPSNLDSATSVGVQNGRSDAHGYRYAIPRIARYRVTKNSCPARFSFVGLDRDSNPPALTTGEYFVDHANGKMMVWPLDPTTKLLESREGTTRASQAIVIGQTRAQGVVRIGGKFYFSTSSQDGTKFGRLYINSPGNKSRTLISLYGIEDMYYERDTDRLWNSTEYPKEREVFSIPRNKLK